MERRARREGEPSIQTQHSADLSAEDRTLGARGNTWRSLRAGLGASRLGSRWVDVGYRRARRTPNCRRKPGRDGTGMANSDRQTGQEAKCPPKAAQKLSAVPQCAPSLETGNMPLPRGHAPTRHATKARGREGHAVVWLQERSRRHRSRAPQPRLRTRTSRSWNLSGPTVLSSNGCSACWGAPARQRPRRSHTSLQHRALRVVLNRHGWVNARREMLELRAPRCRNRHGPSTRACLAMCLQAEGRHPASGRQPLAR